LVAFDFEGEQLAVTIAPAVVDVEVPVTSPFKTVPLQIKLRGSTPPGLAISTFEQSMPEVTIFGPQKYLNALEFYDGLEIDLSQLKSSSTFDFVIPLKAKAERVEPAQVSVTITLVASGTLTLSDVPITINGQNEDYAYSVLEPKTTEIDVSLEAAPEVIANLTKDNVRLLVDVSNLTPGEYDLPLGYNLPSFVEISPGNPVTVRLKVEAKPAEPSVSSPPAGESAASIKQPATGGNP
jgi:YbbR domain-containing protein